MPMQRRPEELLAEQTRQFASHGFVTIPAALEGRELAQMQRAFDDDRRAWPQCWELRGKSRDGSDHWSGFGGEVGEKGRWQTEPLCRTDAFDRCIWHPATFPLLCRLMGPATMRLVHMSAMSRDPVAEAAPMLRDQDTSGGIHYQMWHREQGGSFAPDHPFCLRTSARPQPCRPPPHCGRSCRGTLRRRSLLALGRQVHGALLPGRLR
eukprot:SAG11_NODE_86_length_17300_cov_11.466717_5_plen_208_part_00